MEFRESVVTALDEVLDKMAFMFMEEGENEGQYQAEDFDIVIQISFKGAVEGRTNLFLMSKSADMITRNLIGLNEDAELYEGTLEDAIKEFTNMLMGRTLTLFEPDHRFDMGVPFICTQDAALGKEESSFEIEGNMDDEPFLIRLQIA